jgi:hypothetical protein
MSMLKKVGDFAKSPQGRKLIEDAKRFAQEPQNRRKLEDLLGRRAVGALLLAAALGPIRQDVSDADAKPRTN